MKRKNAFKSMQNNFPWHEIPAVKSFDRAEPRGQNGYIFAFVNAIFLSC